MAEHKLSDTFLKNLKTSAQKKFSDGGGLYIQLMPTGSKLWRMAYRYNGKQKLLSFGAYPAVSLKLARQWRDEAKELLARNIDPAKLKKETKQVNIAKTVNTFENIAREWFNLNEPKWASTTHRKILAFLEKDAFPYIGHMPVNEITAPDMLKLVRRIEARGVLETAHRVLSCCGQVFRYAIATGRAEQDVTAYLRGALAPTTRQHYASITNPKAVGQLLRDIDAYEGHFVVSCALKLAPLVFVRPKELRCAEWTEFNFDVPEWRIPKERMKMKEQHIVPLSRQALQILNQLKAYTGDGRYVFPGIRSVTQPMSDNTLNAALRRMGYTKEQMTTYGFRSTASTLLNELGYNRDWVERQLAHGERDQIRAAYNFADYLAERRVMIQEWADYLDKLKTD